MVGEGVKRESGGGTEERWGGVVEDFEGSLCGIKTSEAIPSKA